MTMQITDLLAFQSSPVLYVNPLKIAVVVVVLVCWSAAAQWIDRDTDVVKTKRERWNLVVISGGVSGLFALLAVPVWHGNLFAVGVAFWVLLSGGSMLAYVIHRNGRVRSQKRVLTIGHLKRLVGGENKRKVKDKGQRVQIVDHEGKFVELPDDAEDAEEYQVTQEFLYDLLWRRASDADVLAGKEQYRLVYKIDGVATERPGGISTEVGGRLFRFLKRISGLDVSEIRKPQTGKIEASLLSQEGAIGPTEVHTSGTTAGERLRLKIQPDVTVRRLHELGLPGGRLKRIKQLLAKPHGLFILSAPSQHGLTTTQYGILRSHDAYMNNIHALERRPLSELDNITQVRYEGSNADVNYARMLQSMLRREPNIVLVGECEDRETASIAARGAADDRKIYLGMEAKDTFDALGKFLVSVGDNKLAARALLGICNQRLVRILCDECREAFEPDPKTLKKLNLPADKIEHFYRPPSEPKLDRRGREIACPKCQGTGYFGRTGIFELLIVDDTIRTLLAAGAPVNRIRSQCRKNRMYYLQEEGILRVMDGTTSMNEVLRCLGSGNKKP